MRFELVPKEMSEERFWCNYFYRVYLMKQTCEVSSLASEADSERTPTASSVMAAAAKSLPLRAPVHKEEVDNTSPSFADLNDTLDAGGRYATLSQMYTGLSLRVFLVCTPESTAAILIQKFRIL